MGLFEMFVWSATAPRRKRRPKYTWDHPHPRSIAAKIQRRKAEKEYLRRAVRRMELNAEARKIYDKRHPTTTPHVVPGAAPESRYSNPEFWANREPKVKAYKDPRDFWTR
jgi:hypothetical protein